MSPNRFKFRRFLSPLANRSFAVASLFFAALSLANAETKAGDIFPALNATALDGGQVPAIAGKVVLVDFWASWCAQCRESFPSYTQLQADYATRGLVIVAVSVDQNPGAFSAFVKKMKPSFPTLRDKDHQLVRAVEVPVMPTCYLIDRNGRVHSIHAGFHGTVTERDLRHEIDSLLAKTSPAS